MKHKIGKCGAVVWLTKKGAVCAECKKLIKKNTSNLGKNKYYRQSR